VSIHGPENGTFLNPRRIEPGFQRPDRAVNGSAVRNADPPADAVLIGFRPPDGQNNPHQSGHLNGSGLLLISFLRLRRLSP
jgi:hypothetical protein